MKMVNNYLIVLFLILFINGCTVVSNESKDNAFENLGNNNMNNINNDNKNGSNNFNNGANKNNNRSSCNNSSHEKSTVCGEQLCDSVCCVSSSGLTCIEDENNYSMGCSFYIACDGPEDCEGDEQCLMIGSGISRTICKEPYENMNENKLGGAIIMCHDNCDCPQDMYCKLFFEEIPLSKCEYTDINSNINSQNSSNTNNHNQSNNNNDNSSVIIKTESTKCETSIQCKSGEVCEYPNEHWNFGYCTNYETAECVEDSDCFDGTCIAWKCYNNENSNLKGSYGDWMLCNNESCASNPYGYLELFQIKDDNLFSKTNTRFYNTVGSIEERKITGKYATNGVNFIQIYKYEQNPNYSYPSTGILENNSFILEQNAQFLPFYPHNISNLSNTFLHFGVYNISLTSQNTIEYVKNYNSYEIDVENNKKTLKSYTKTLFKIFSSIDHEVNQEVCIYWDIFNNSDLSGTGELCAEFEYEKKYDNGALLLHKEDFNSFCWEEMGCPIQNALNICDIVCEELNGEYLYITSDKNHMLTLKSNEFKYTKIDMNDEIKIPKGEIMIGSPDDKGEEDEHPIHNVFLSTYNIDKYEVSLNDYYKCINEGICKYPELIGLEEYYQRFNDLEYKNQPVQFVTWKQALTYCNWQGKNLPTETQWEKAARGPHSLEYPWGTEDNPDYYNDDLFNMDDVDSNYNGRSPYEILNMIGNAPEWVWDYYDKNYYSVSPYKNPEGPADSVDYEEDRVIRGHSMFGPRAALRVSLYNDIQIMSSILPYGIGFRCARY